MLAPASCIHLPLFIFTIDFLNIYLNISLSLDIPAGQYYPLGTIGTVPRAYDILGPTKEWKKMKI
jgi:hypothetical protein